VGKNLFASKQEKNLANLGIVWCEIRDPLINGYRWPGWSGGANPLDFQTATVCVTQTFRQRSRTREFEKNTISSLNIDLKCLDMTYNIQSIRGAIFLKELGLAYLRIVFEDFWVFAKILVQNLQIGLPRVLEKKISGGFQWWP